MKIDEKFILKTVDGHTVIFDSQSGKSFSEADFSEIRLFLWGLLKSHDVTKAQMLDEVLGQFDISTVLALGEIDGFIKIIKEYGII